MQKNKLLIILVFCQGFSVHWKWIAYTMDRYFLTLPKSPTSNYTSESSVVCFLIVSYMYGYQ